jgi:hypothetical protein
VDPASLIRCDGPPRRTRGQPLRVGESARQPGRATGKARAWERACDGRAVHRGGVRLEARQVRPPVTRLPPRSARASRPAPSAARPRRGSLLASPTGREGMCVQRSCAPVRPTATAWSAPRAFSSAAQRPSGSIAAGQRVTGPLADAGDASPDAAPPPFDRTSPWRSARCGSARSSIGGWHASGRSAVGSTDPGPVAVVAQSPTRGGVLPIDDGPACARGPRDAGRAIIGSGAIAACDVDGLAGDHSVLRRSSADALGAAFHVEPPSNGDRGPSKRRTRANPGPLDPALSPAHSRSMITRRAGSRPWLRLATPS